MPAATTDPFAEFRKAMEELAASLSAMPVPRLRLGATPTTWWFDESGLYRPAKRPPLIHNGRKPRK